MRRQKEISLPLSYCDDDLMNSCCLYHLTCDAMRSDVDPVQTSKEIQFEKMLKLILFQAYSLGLVSKTFEKELHGAFTITSRDGAMSTSTLRQLYPACLVIVTSTGSVKRVGYAHGFLFSVKGGRGWIERSEGNPGVSLVPRSNPGHPYQTNNHR